MPITPGNLMVAELVGKLNDGLREHFEERAGIIEFDGRLPRDHAECLALLDVVKRDPFALTGMVVLRIGLRGHFHHVIAIDEARARGRLVQRGYCVSNPLDLTSILTQHFGGEAQLIAL